MKKYSSKRNLLYKATKLSETAGYIAIATTSSIYAINLSQPFLSNRPIATHVIEKAQEFGIIAYALGLLLITLGVIGRLHGDPWIWGKIKFILDEYQDRAFNNDENDSQDHHRVTLFKFKEKCWFCKRWNCISFFSKEWAHHFRSDFLVPVLRSGHQSQKTKTSFLVPDSSDECEGVAGKAWANVNSVIVPNLPLVKKRMKKNDKADYANNTYSDQKMIDHYINIDRKMPRSIAAIPVMVKNEPWGVLVLDSRRPDGVDENSVLNFTLTVSLIGHLLEKS
ncbi:hypothetical protein SAMN05660443_0223 [Marinospirillum celere]|uniref:GAF domain-containing protein n=1 Tax=Marinospirillum celere TaxID=1122252 RepID=A0A1I1E5Y1_9GAMM|nr:GAF domain-containing protein [Marinospirillum celere]SFB80293.1 hypothetical protein SAMN05660443_0223 [Marinospirillum celere]